MPDKVGPGGAGVSPTNDGGRARPEVEWVPSFPRIRRIDELWYRAESWLCGVIFLAMSLMVVAEVISNTFVKGITWRDVGLLFGLCYLGTRTRVVKQGENRMSQARSVAIAAGITVIVSAAISGYARWFPGGLLWTQKIALVALLWVSLLGASMATYERAHLALELGEKLWPKLWLHSIKALAHAVTSAFCLALAYSSVRIVIYHIDTGTMVDPLQFPRWIAVIILPYAFVAMAIRFGGQTYTIATKQAKPIDERVPT